MAVAAQTPTTTVVSSDESFDVPFTFRIDKTTDLVVEQYVGSAWVAMTRVDSLGAITDPISANYELAYPDGESDWVNGGTVTCWNLNGSGTSVSCRVKRDVSLTQEYAPVTLINLANLVLQLDRIVMMMQESELLLGDHAVRHEDGGDDELTLAQSQITGLAAALAAKLAIASNLSDLADASTARTNLGLGDSAVLDVGTTSGTVAAGDDSRFEDARDPTAHATEHVDGTDDIRDATALLKGLATAAQITALEAATAAQHTQGTDQGLDTGGANAVTAAAVKGAVDHAAAGHAPSGAEANPDEATEAEAEAGLVTALRSWSPADIKTAIDALAATLEAHASDHVDGTDDIQLATAAQKGLMSLAYAGKLDGIATGADVTGDNTPQAHKTSHTDGSDDIQDATAGHKGLATAAQITKLDGIDASADVTDKENVESALASITNIVLGLIDTHLIAITKADGSLWHLSGGSLKASLKTVNDALYVKDSEFTAAGQVLIGSGAGTFTRLLNKLDATTAPVVGDDTADGYSPGSIWVDVTADIAYICLDATAGAAVWRRAQDYDADLAAIAALSPSEGNRLRYGSAAWELLPQTSAIGNLGATPSPTLVPDAEHSAVVSADITSWAGLTGLENGEGCDILYTNASYDVAATGLTAAWSGALDDIDASTVLMSVWISQAGTLTAVCKDAS